MNREFRKLRDRAGVSGGTMHDFRRTCITNWLKDLVPPHEVQRMAGHSSIETTMKYYVKVDSTAMDRVREASTRSMARVLSVG